MTKSGVEIDYVAGTSIGAVFASGNLDSLKEVILQFGDFLTLSSPNQGSLTART
jgi:predicted acylesterase/phospholipase RssA